MTGGPLKTTTVFIFALAKKESFVSIYKSAIQWPVLNTVWNESVKHK